MCVLSLIQSYSYLISLPLSLSVSLSSVNPSYLLDILVLVSCEHNSSSLSVPLFSSVCFYFFLFSLPVSTSPPAPLLLSLVDFTPFALSVQFNSIRVKHEAYCQAPLPSRERKYGSITVRAY